MSVRGSGADEDSTYCAGISDSGDFRSSRPRLLAVTNTNY
jgi:hypothetical protein